MSIHDIVIIYRSTTLEHGIMAVLQYKPKAIQPNKSKLKSREYLKWNTISDCKMAYKP